MSYADRLNNLSALFSELDESRSRGPRSARGYRSWTPIGHSKRGEANERQEGTVQAANIAEGEAKSLFGQMSGLMREVEGMSLSDFDEALDRKVKQFTKELESITADIQDMRATVKSLFAMARKSFQ